MITFALLRETVSLIPLAENKGFFFGEDGAEAHWHLGANLSLQRGFTSLSLRTKDWVLQHFGNRNVGQKEGLQE